MEAIDESLLFMHASCTGATVFLRLYSKDEACIGTKDICFRLAYCLPCSRFHFWWFS